ncbi:MAG: heavy metal translocating P-type ATPase [Phycisphaerae bacterium]
MSISRSEIIVGPVSRPVSSAGPVSRPVSVEPVCQFTNDAQAFRTRDPSTGQETGPTSSETGQKTGPTFSETDQEPGPTSPRAPLCDHCGLPVPAGLIEPDAEPQFCCAGCRAVYAVIHECGLEQYYRVRQAQPASARASRISGRRFDEFDDPAFEALYVGQIENNLRTVELFLDGVHCGACTWLVERLPRVCPGVIESRLDSGRALVRLVWDPSRVRLSQAARALDSLGYSPHAAQHAKAREIHRRDERRMLVRIALAGAAAGNEMLLAFALYAGAASGMEPIYEQFFRWLSMLIGVTALVWPGASFFRGAWAAIRTRTTHLDLPIALALFAGGIAGAVNTILNRGEIYFDSLSMLVFLLLVGRWFQRRQQRQAADAVELLFSLTPSAARRVLNGELRDVPIEAVRAGDEIEIRAGETIPVDGVIESGESAVDQSLLTGEAQPLDRAPGDDVCAGTLNVSATLRVRARATGVDTRVGKLMALVERSAREAPPIVQFADRLAGRLTIAMLALAAFTLTAWLFIAPERAIDRATALLLVTCPCALGLATPLIITVAIGRAARRGILVKGGEAFETLARGGQMFLDKTGTLTEGRLRLIAWHTTPDFPREADDWLRLAVAALERHATHPIAKALVAGLAGDSQATESVREQVRNYRQRLGAGVEGLVDGRQVRAGSTAFIQSAGVRFDDWSAARVAEISARGNSPVVVACDDAVMAVAGLGDAVRSDTKRAIEALQSAGWRSGILSGDDARVVFHTGDLLGIDRTATRGAATPEIKLQVVQAARSSGPVVMVGDGVNDAAALSAASVGIAVHGGAEASLAAAHVYLSRPGLTPIVELVDTSRQVFRAIRRGLYISLTYNVLAAALAMTGVLTPLIAAILMPISSFTVLALALDSQTSDAAPTQPARYEGELVASAKSGACTPLVAGSAS